MNWHNHPCLEARGKHPSCKACKISRRGLCNAYCTFINKYRREVPPGDLGEKICRLTDEAIHKEIGRFTGVPKGKEGEAPTNIEGVFISFCSSIFRHKRAEVYRDKQSVFENDKLEFIGNHQRDENDEYSLLERLEYKSRETIDEIEGEYEPVEMVEQKMAVERLLEKLGTMISEGDECGALVMQWYEFMKNGIIHHNKMAEELGMKPNSFNVKLKRCQERIAGELT